MNGRGDVSSVALEDTPRQSAVTGAGAASVGRSGMWETDALFKSFNQEHSRQTGYLDPPPQHSKNRPLMIS